MRFTPFALVVAAVLAVALAAGCSKRTDQSSQTSTTATQGSTTAAPGSPTTTPLGDVAHGKQIFAANCAACHGATGVEGGIGPSLKGEKAKKDYAATIVWIHNPNPPMPKLWPSPLNDKDVRDVAAYVQAL